LVIDTKVVAQRTGISPTMVYYIATGARGIGKTTALKLSKASKRSVGWWITASPEQVEKEFAKLSKERANGLDNTACQN